MKKKFNYLKLLTEIFAIITIITLTILFTVKKQSIVSIGMSERILVVMQYVVCNFFYSILLSDILGNSYYKKRYGLMYEHYFIVVKENTILTVFLTIISIGFYIFSFKDFSYQLYALVTGFPLIMYYKNEILAVRDGQAYYFVNFREEKIEHYISNNYKFLSFVTEYGKRYMAKIKNVDKLKEYVQVMKNNNVEEYRKKGSL